MNNKVKKLIVLGASAYPEICEIIYDINKIKKTYEVIYLLDDNEKLHHKRIEGVEVKGSLSLANKFPDDLKFVFGIGSYKTRLIRNEILMRLKIPTNRFETLIHPAAKVYSSAIISTGVIIYPGSVIFCNTKIGPFVIIVANTIIGANNIIGKGALITSLVSTTSGVKIGSFSFIGTGTKIAENVEIGPGSLVSMGTFVHRSIKPGSFALGDPFKIIKKEQVPEEIIHEWEVFKNKCNKGALLWKKLKSLELLRIH